MSFQSLTCRVLGLAFLVTMSWGTAPARGDLVTTGIVPITLSGQDIIVNATAPSLWAAGTGVLTFEGRGDFDGIEEQVDLYLDNILIGTAGRGLPGSTVVLGAVPGLTGLHQLTASFTVSESIMQQILGAKTSLAFRMDLTSTVGGNVAFADDFVSASLSYSSVPEPTSLALVGLVGCAGLGIRRWRKRA